MANESSIPGSPKIILFPRNTLLSRKNESLVTMYMKSKYIYANFRMDNVLQNIKKELAYANSFLE